MSYFSNKVVIVTGGSDGIGKALVDLLLGKGAKVATCGRNYDKLYSLQTLYAGKPLLTLQVDVSNEQECGKLITETVKLFGGIDMLINNAGISMRALFEETDLQTLRKVMDINFWGTVNCTKHALPYIIKNKGTLAGISSIAGYRGLPGRTGYSASKFAVNGFLESLRTELLESGVNVMWACPGFTASNIRNAALDKDSKQQGTSPMDESEMMNAETCATLILSGIEKRKRNMVLTFNDKRTVFINRIFPSLADRLTRKYFFKNGKLVR